MKAQRRKRGIDPLILNFGARWRWVFTFMPQLFYPWKKKNPVAITQARWATEPICAVLEKWKSLAPVVQPCEFWTFSMSVQHSSKRQFHRNSGLTYGKRKCRSKTRPIRRGTVTTNFCVSNVHFFPPFQLSLSFLSQENNAPLSINNFKMAEQSLWKSLRLDTEEPSAVIRSGYRPASSPELTEAKQI